MSARGIEIRVGAAVVVAGVILVIGTMWFQKFQMMEKRYSFYVSFSEVGGLLVGDPIFVNGLDRGRVNNMTLQPDRVVVEMAVRDGVVIPDDSQISLKSIGIMGERFVAIRQGTSANFIAPGDTLTGEFLMGMSEVMGSAGSILGDVEVTVRQLREISESLNSDGKLQQGVSDLAATSGNLRQLTENNRARLERSLAHFERSAAMLDSLIGGRYAELDSSLAAIARAGGSAETTADNLAAASKDLREITARLRAGEGTAGRLLNDDELIHRLESTVSEMDSLMEDIRKHPNKYVKFSLF
ncbi:MAG TPA: MlaD family protein [Candidatus Krumholzibacteria bacterium]|nr:MlaD family protein [Candidatus Krumholzibacteria bacterium]